MCMACLSPVKSLNVLKINRACIILITTQFNASVITQMTNLEDIDRVRRQVAIHLYTHTG